MALTIEQVEDQIFQLQKLLDEMRNPKMEVTRHFTGQYFKPYKDNQYRRMESEGIPIWEFFSEVTNDWTTVGEQESAGLETTYHRDCEEVPVD